MKAPRTPSCDGGRDLSTDGETATIGDGTNDAPALAAADLGIALDDGTARTAEAADAVVTNDDLRGALAVFDLAAGTRRRIRENVRWALLYNAIAIPLAAGPDQSAVHRRRDGDQQRRGRRQLLGPALAERR